MEFSNPFFQSIIFCFHQHVDLKTIQPALRYFKNTGNNWLHLETLTLLMTAIAIKYIDFNLKLISKMTNWQKKEKQSNAVGLEIMVWYSCPTGYKITWCYSRRPENNSHIPLRFVRRLLELQPGTQHLPAHLLPERYRRQLPDLVQRDSVPHLVHYRRVKHDVACVDCRHVHRFVSQFICSTWYSKCLGLKLCFCLIVKQYFFVKSISTYGIGIYKVKVKFPFQN